MSHIWLCGTCQRPMTASLDTPSTVLVESFVVTDLMRVMPNGYVQHPMVCSDRCYGRLLRRPPLGWDISPWIEDDDDGDEDDEEEGYLCR